jgi:hypothetical protein
MKKWRLNFFDAAIIAAVLAAAFILVKMRGGGTPLIDSGSAAKVRYVIELTNLTREATVRIKKGDSVTDKIEKHAMGTVSDFAIEPYIYSSKDWTTGDYKPREIPGRYIAKLTLEAPATVTASSITVGGAFLVRCGAEVNALGPGYGGSGYIIDVLRDELEGGAQ